MENKICIGCKKEFIGNVKQQIYCSGKCRDKHKGIKMTCIICEKEFIGKPTRKFCSIECFQSINVKRITDQNIRNRKYPAIEGMTRQQVFWRFNPECKIKTLKRDRDKRNEVIKYLGNKCVKCGYDIDIRALVLDHVKSDGKKDRKEKGSKIYRYYLNHLDEAKLKLQVLCANCNLIKSFENDEYNVSKRIKEEEYKF